MLLYIFFIKPWSCNFLTKYLNLVKEKLYEEEELWSDDPINTEYLPSDESCFDPLGENNFETLGSCNIGIEKDKNRREVTSSDDSP